MNLCECGCEEEVNYDSGRRDRPAKNTFKMGHWNKTPEMKEFYRKLYKGKPRSEYDKQRMRDGWKKSSARPKGKLPEKWRKNAQQGLKNYYAKLSKDSDKYREWQRNVKIGLTGRSNGNYSHSEETKKKIGAANRRAWSLKSKTEKKRISELHSRISKITWPRPQFIEELGHNIRSAWEQNVFTILKKKGINYKYEPQRLAVTIDGKKCVYIPDAILEDGSVLEVKGYLSERGRKKLISFKKQNPDTKLIIIIGRQNFFKAQFADKVIDYHQFIKSQDVTVLNHRTEVIAY